MNKLTLSDVVDEKLVEALRLVQCMLEDFRAQNYGDAHGWIRHIDSAMSEYTDAHTDDAYSMLHDLLQSGNSGLVPAGYVLVPVEPTDLMVEAMYRNQLSMRGALKAAIAASPAVSDGWIPVSERMPNKHEDVLVFETLNKDKLVASHKGDGHFYWNLNEEGREEYIDVSHWQPLPDAPKGV